MGDRLVALLAQDVEDRLGGDQLPHGRDQRRVAEVAAHARDLLQDLVEAVGRIVLFQLALDVLEHEAGHLVAEHV